MKQTRKQLALDAVASAMKVRRDAKCSLACPINIFDFAERLGVSVFFQDIPSMEGIYTPGARPRPAIIVSSLRPAGRKAMTCGHELGHHLYKHGQQWDELVDNRSQTRRFDPQEFLADVFSAFLQMPKLAVSNQLVKRSLDASTCSAECIYALSTVFGVSYGGFVTHMEKSLGLIDMRRASNLASAQPKDLRESILGSACPQNLIVVDTHWEGKAVDIEVGDSVILPPGVHVEGTGVHVSDSDPSRTVAAARVPGICRVSNSTGWSSFIRISRKNYVGRAPYRFDEEVSDEP